MSRQFNPVVNSYNNISKVETEVKKARPSGGLLAPRNPMVNNTSEDLSQPVTRVKKHLQAIHERRTNTNGS